MRSCTLADKVKQKHIDKQTDMISESVSAVHIDVIDGKIPYLYNGKCAQDIGEEHLSVHKSVCGLMQQRIIPADHIYKDQIVYQLKILDLFFLISG